MRLTDDGHEAGSAAAPAARPGVWQAQGARGRPQPRRVGALGRRAKHRVQTGRESPAGGRECTPRGCSPPYTDGEAGQCSSLTGGARSASAPQRFPAPGVLGRRSPEGGAFPALAVLQTHRHRRGDSVPSVVPPGDPLWCRVDDGQGEQAVLRFVPKRIGFRCLLDAIQAIIDLANINS